MCRSLCACVRLFVCFCMLIFLCICCCLRAHIYIYFRIYLHVSLHHHHHHHHHHVVPLARISLTLSHHFSLSFIASGRFSGLHPVSSHSCCMYVLAGRPTHISAVCCWEEESVRREEWVRRGWEMDCCNQNDIIFF